MKNKKMNAASNSSSKQPQKQTPTRLADDRSEKSLNSKPSSADSSQAKRATPTSSQSGAAIKSKNIK
ncbi:MAG: hypothetical protein H7235_07450 [Bdellovibrionaceae bacterium]|nr:hypothetical protein [Pseudobdellovibrionaceae bacterium]